MAKKKFILKILTVLPLIGCETRTQFEAESELEVILGEKVTCYGAISGEGHLCRGNDSKKHYYCPNHDRKPCFFTNRLQLLDPPAEAGSNSN